jgi:hypothetical protein
MATKLDACGIMPHPRGAGKQILSGALYHLAGNARSTGLLTAAVRGYIVRLNTVTGHQQHLFRLKNDALQM